MSSERKELRVRANLEFARESERRALNTLRNILYSTDSCVLFLDNDLRLTFFTPAAERMLRTISSDLGRPVWELLAASWNANLADDASAVLAGRKRSSEREIETNDGRFLTQQITPRRSEDNHIDGVVVSYVESSRALQMEEMARGFARHMANAVQHPVAILDEGLRVRMANDPFNYALPASAANAQLDVTDFAGEDPRLINRIDAFVSQAAVAQPRQGSIEIALRSSSRFTRLRLTVIASRPGSSWLVLELIERSGSKAGSNMWLPQGLSAAFHELQQPMQTLSFAQGLLAKTVSEPEIAVLVRQIEQSLAAIGGMMQSLREIAEPLDAASSAPDTLYRISDVLLPLQLEFSYHAASRRFGWRVVRSSAQVKGDSRALMSLLRMLLFRLIPGIGEGRVLLGARRTAGELAIELWARHGAGSSPRPAEAAQLASATVGALAGDDFHLERLAELVGGRVEVRPPNSPGPLARVLVSLATNLASAPASRQHEMLGGAEDRGDTVATENPPGKHEVPVFLVDDDSSVLETLAMTLRERYVVSSYPSAEAFLDAFDPSMRACIVVDARLPGMDGYQLLNRLREIGSTRSPCLMITGHGEIRGAVRAMQSGAIDFLEKPVPIDALIAGIERAISATDDSGARAKKPDPESQKLLTNLTPRQGKVMGLVVEGHSNKEIAVRLGVSQRTVENHRAEVMRRTGSKTLSDLIRLVLSSEVRPR